MNPIVAGVTELTLKDHQHVDDFHGDVLRIRERRALNDHVERERLIAERSVADEGDREVENGEEPDAVGEDLFDVPAPVLFFELVLQDEDADWGYARELPTQLNAKTKLP